MQKLICKDDSCQGELMWQCDYDFEDCGYNGEGIVVVYICRKCELLHELIITDVIEELKICEYGDVIC